MSESGQYITINSEGALEKNPITTAGKIMVNCYNDHDNYKLRKENTKFGLQLYPAATDDSHFSVLPHEICLAQTTQVKKSKRDTTNAFVFSCFNGFGRKGDKLWQLNETLDFNGIAPTGANYDHKMHDTQVDFATQIGGLHTFGNNGPKRINNGDYVYWEVPPPATPKGRGSDRLTVVTLPYDPTFDRLTKQSFIDIILNNQIIDLSNENNFPLIESAQLMKRSMGTLQVIGLHVLFASGLVKYDPDMFGQDAKQRRENANVYMNDPNREEVMIKLAKNVGVLKNDKKSKLSVEVIGSNADRTTKAYLLEDALIQALTAQNESLLVVPYEPGTKDKPSGLKGELLNQQVGFLNKYFAAFGKGLWYKQRRIFAKAQTSGDPGKYIDGLIRPGCIN